MKNKIIFICGNCGYESPKWAGKCASCGEFNTYKEETQAPKKALSGYRPSDGGSISSLTEIAGHDEERLLSGMQETDRVFGGGIVKGSLVLMGGEPGAGKSTLALCISDNIAKTGKKVLYVSGEESPRQIKMRADRTGARSEKLMVLAETSVERIAAAIEKERPELAVIDSIQTVYKEDIEASAGSVSQVKESCAHLIYTAKTLSVPVLIIGHVTKDGAIAGPKMLEHMVDAVMYFESEKHNNFKILRSVKNRFGSTNEMGLFELSGKGIKEIINPSEYLLENLKGEKEGSAVVSVMEGTRVLMLEIQALVSRKNFGTPQRTVTGVDYSRFLLILAILEKKLGLNMENQDVFVNVGGGIKIPETGADLGIAAAVYSGYTARPVSSKMVFIGELGLDGGVRPVRFMEQRVSDARKMGFETYVLPKRHGINAQKTGIKEIGNISELSGIIQQQ
ncbi:MAG: DNA repair protein RadA [Candidatus Goldiibacteriota bacterium]